MLIRQMYDDGVPFTEIARKVKALDLDSLRNHMNVLGLRPRYWYTPKEVRSVSKDNNPR